MKSFQTKTAVAILLVAGGITPAFGQGRGNGGGHSEGRDHGAQGQRGQGHEQQARPQQARPQTQQFQQRGSREARPAQQQPIQSNQRQFQSNQRQQVQSNQRQQYQGSQRFEQQRSYQPQQYRSQNNFRGGNSFSGFSSHNWQNDHRNWSQRGGYRGYFIPRDRFYVSFGPQHYFHIGRPAFYNGFPRFYYGGYSFLMMDPWPDYWGDDWYDSDDVYVDYQNDGYYMYNRRYPGVGIALNIEF